MDMKDVKQMGQNLKEEVKDMREAAQEKLGELKADTQEKLGGLREQVKADAQEVKRAAAEKKEIFDAEKELRIERLKAEVEHNSAVRQMKKDVEAEAKELKKLIGEE